MQVLGLDIGGSGIKGAPVDTDKGALMTERHRIATPDPSKPESVADVIAEIAAHFDWTGPLGSTFPAVIKDGVAHTAANVDKDWIGTDAAGLIREHTGCATVVLNDADAAGLAEMQFGAGREEN
ncbi:MAG: ROK family protein, partial [Armatimonadetes bacterium]|nr:ROK family protein [Armatimonadota bacterium]